MTKKKRTKPRRVPHPLSKTLVAVCGSAHQERFDSVAALAAAIEGIAEDTGLGPLGISHFVGETRYSEEFPPEGLERVLASAKLGKVWLTCDHGEMDTYRLPANQCIPGLWDVNVQIRIRRTVGDVGSGLELLEALVKRVGIFWGEVCDTRLTDQPTFCGVNEHSMRVPGFANANYLGEEYIKYFGGVERLRSLPHLRVEPFGEGIVTFLENCADSDEFYERRKEVRQMLGDELFEPRVPVWKSLFWPETPWDEGIGEAFIQAVMQIGVDPGILCDEQDEQEDGDVK